MKFLAVPTTIPSFEIVEKNFIRQPIMSSQWRSVTTTECNLKNCWLLHFLTLNLPPQQRLPALGLVFSFYNLYPESIFMQSVRQGRDSLFRY
jgi:hypothetical protein